jgi:DNA polymerase-4
MAIMNPAMSRSILHVDMDAFYASVEERDAPALKGRPVIVGGTGNRGVVAAANYEVRKFGVHSAMPMREALQRCPHAVCISPRMQHYQSVSAQIFEVFRCFTPLVEGLSLDEAFLDVTASQTIFGTGAQIAQQIKTAIRDRTQLTASVGVAPNKLVAKIASDLRKPDGLVIVAADEVTALLDPLPITRLFGIGKKTAAAVHSIGIHTLGELHGASDAQLRAAFGRYAGLMRERAAGIDHREVIADENYKQISAEETFDTDITDVKQLSAALWQLVDRVGVRVRREDVVGECVTLKVRRFDFKTYTRQQRVTPGTRQNKVIGELAHKLLVSWLREHDHPPVRLLGVGVSSLASQHQPDLFDATEPAKDRRLDDALDEIRRKFGTTMVRRGSSISRPE